MASDGGLADAARLRVARWLAHVLLGDEPRREAAAARFGADVWPRSSQHEQAEVFADAQQVIYVPDNMRAQFHPMIVN